MKLKTLAASILLVVSGATFAAEPYDPIKSYSAGDEVSFNGHTYRAKWWVAPGQYPGAPVEHPWDTPWELEEEGDGITPPTTDENPPPPTNPPVEDSEYPPYVAGTKYKGGDIVFDDGQLYRCKVGVTEPWCSGAPWAYEPGKGTSWTDAWERITEADLTNPPPGLGPGNPDDLEQPEDPDQGVNPENGYQVSQKSLDEKEAELTDFPMMEKVKESIRTLDNESVERIMPLAETNPENVKRVERIVTGNDWEYLFPKRAVEYTYRNFLQAVGKFPAFCQIYTDGRDSDAICRRSLAIMFAHFTQETGGHTAHWDVPEWRQGLVHVREMGWTEDMRGGYNGECNPNVWQGQTWPCGTFPNGEFKSYFGRGAKQLSYNYNYGPFSLAMYGTIRTLLDRPELVADTWLNLASAVFFFVYPQPPKPSMQFVIDGTWKPNDRDLSNGLVPGFGVTTQIINGGVECGGSVEVAQSLNRISYFRSFAGYLGVPIPEDEVLGCKGMKSFDEYGAGAVNIYWEKDWGWSSQTPTGATYSCQLVSYQTPFSAFVFRDFTRCVKKHFPDVIVTN